MTKKKIVCECKTHDRLALCEHLIAAIRLRGEGSFRAFVRTYSAPTLSSSVETPKRSGSKPGAQERKGGRTAKVTPQQAASIVYNNGYLVVRKTGRVKKCLGCKKEYSKEVHVIQHQCRLPYPAKTDDGKLVYVTPSKPVNHYFHCDRGCVIMNHYHKDFDGHIAISPSLQATYLKRELLKAGFIVDA